MKRVLRREIQALPTLTPEQSEYMEIGPRGTMHLKKNSPPPSPEACREMIERMEQEDDERDINPKSE